MSLKIKFKDNLWSNLESSEYSYDNLPSPHTYPALNMGYPQQSVLSMSIHPDWIALMDQLEVGDVVTTHTGVIGVITKIYEDRISLLGMRKYEVLIGNEREIFFSINLKKVENEDE
tara:strand:+ start:118 stop:465 length:348 start_codon:yes stop_codon:yes gene_type:complete